MGKMLLTDMRRAFGGWAVWGGALLLFLTLVTMSANEILHGSDPASMNAVERFLTGLIPTGAPFLAPVICCLPMGVSFCDDYVTGFGRTIVQRTGIYRYLFGRILSTAFSGGFTLLFGMVLYIVLCFLVFTGNGRTDPNLANVLNMYRSYGVYSWLPDGLVAGYWLMAAYGLQYFLCGAVWAVAGLAISALVVNRYAALALPYISIITLWFLFGRLRLFLFNPYSYLHPYGLLSSFGVLLLGIGVQMVLFGGIFLLVGKRRLLYE